MRALANSRQLPGPRASGWSNRISTARGPSLFRSGLSEAVVYEPAGPGANVEQAFIA